MYQENPYSLILTDPFFSMYRVFDYYISQSIKNKDTITLHQVIDTMKTVYKDPGICARIIQSTYLQYYKGVDDTSMFIKTAKNYISSFLLSINFDSLHIQDENRLNKALQFKFKTTHADSAKDLNQFNKYIYMFHLYQTESENILKDVIFICGYVCKISSDNHDKVLQSKALHWLKSASKLNVENEYDKKRISSIRACLESGY